MPAALVATARELYFVPGLRSAIAAVTDTVEPPLPIAWSGVDVPYDVEVPYSKRTVVASPRGLTPALSVAPSEVTPVAAREEIDGAAAGAAVLKDLSAPRATPAALVATSR